MADKKPLVVYAASYKSLSSTEADLDAIEQLHKDKCLAAARPVPAREAPG